jgi:AmmeMemoRadiSam system protein B
VALSDLEEVVRRLDEVYLLVGQRAQRHEEEHRQQVEAYLDSPVRAAAHAGGAYLRDPAALRRQLAGFFTSDQGPGGVDPAPRAADRRLCAVVSPHIDLDRGGPVFAWSYRQIAEHSDADLFVIFGTAHGPMDQLFCVTEKDFDTPLGLVKTDRQFIERLERHLQGDEAGRGIDLMGGELAHRFEHSIELQAVFLQYILGGRREFRIVPVLAGSLQEFIAKGTQPSESPQVRAFLAAMRAAADEHPGNVCYISGADFAHVGQRFGDQWLLDQKRLAEQAEDDRRLLEAACRCDSAGFFSHVAEQGDCRRVCGLPPTYTMLGVINSSRGELLKYDQVVDPDGTSCVTLASLAYYRD